MERGAKTVWLPLIGEVEWASGGRGQERPLALRCGGKRLALQIEKAWTEGPSSSGAPVWRVFLTRTQLGKRFRISATADARTRVEVETPG